MQEPGRERGADVYRHCVVVGEAIDKARGRQLRAWAEKDCVEALEVTRCRLGDEGVYEFLFKWNTLSALQ